MFVEIKSAVKKYGKGDAEVFALNGVNLSLEKGEICVILGPSGSGKSTLLNMIGGIDSLDSGEIIVDGKNLSQMNKKQLTEYRRNDVGFVFQFFNLIGDLTAKENIQIVKDISTFPFDIDEIMGLLDINSLKYRFPKELSGGQQQKIAIARAMIKNPKILLCDELTGALDSHSGKTVLEVVEKLNKAYKTTVVIITHNEKIAQMADKIVRIKDGKIEEVICDNSKISVSAIEL